MYVWTGIQNILYACTHAYICLHTIYFQPLTVNLNNRNVITLLNNTSISNVLFLYKASIHDTRCRLEIKCSIYSGTSNVRSPMRLAKVVLIQR